MRNWIAIGMLSLYLVSSTEAYQFLKIPILVEHFIEHRQEDPGMTLWAFLKMHYDNPVKDADYQTDQKLPFVSHSGSLTLVFTLDNGFLVELKKWRVPPSKPVALYRNVFYQKDFLSSIWQPPRVG
ncbi:hypothetical protein [Niabella drilacis]|uniref:Uncharacterized protein n=1 Tax=Niabella drilacis (strain DSM 25811 / CCM 8410 / CCUG 62505 / LMG 26954 / E90) TaxID=1285928 RepID=A0A1G6RA68_NIADE|nr:hypothetical protein [Niabella drilacis]SDD01331.1 hypothetical protein SAMN04487894_105204 [Niabella drilacis]